MNETTSAEVVTETPPSEPEPATDAPAIETPPAEEPEQIEEAPAAEEAEPLPEVETSVGFDATTGKHLVTVIIRHPDATVIAVNGRAVWEGNG